MDNTLAALRVDVETRGITGSTGASNQLRGLEKDVRGAASTAQSASPKVDRLNRDIQAMGRAAQNARPHIGNDRSGLFGGILGGAAKLGLAIQGIQGFGYAIGGVTNLVRSSIGESKEWSAQMGRLDAVLKSTGGTAGVTKEQVVGLVNSLSGASGLSRVADEVVASGTNMLLTYTNIGKDVFPRATATLLDMAQAMAGADAQVTDLDGTARQLGRALNDPVKGMAALTRMGVTFTEQQKEQVKAMVASGRTMDAQNLILDELAKKYGGSAKNAAMQFDGVMFTLQERFNNVKQTLGDQLVPVLIRFAGILGSPAVMGTIERTAGLLVSGVVSGLDLAEAAYTRVTAAVDRLRAPFQTVTDLFTTSSHAVNNMFIPALQKIWVGDFTGALDLISYGLGSVKNAFTDVGREGESIGSRVRGALVTLRDDIRARVPEIRTGLSNVVEFSVTVGSGWVDSFVVDAKAGFALAEQRIKDEVIPTFTANLTNGLPTAINATIQQQAPGASASNAVDFLAMVGFLFPPARVAAAGLLIGNQIAPDFVPSLFERLGQLFENPEQFGEKVTGLADSIITGIQGVAAGATGAGMALWSWLTSEETLQGFETSARSLVTAVQAWWTTNGPNLKLDPAQVKAGVETGISDLNASIDADAWNISINDSWNFVNDVWLPKLQKDLPQLPEATGTEVKKHWDEIWLNIVAGMVGAKEADTSNISQGFVDLILTAVANLPQTIAASKELIGAGIWSAIVGVAAVPQEVTTKLDIAEFLIKAIAWDKLEEVGAAIFKHIFGDALKTDDSQSRQEAIDSFFYRIWLDVEDAALEWGEKIGSALIGPFRSAFGTLPGMTDELLNQLIPSTIDLPESTKDRLERLGMTVPELVAAGVANNTQQPLRDSFDALGTDALGAARNAFGGGSSSGSWGAVGAPVPGLIGGGVVKNGTSLTGGISTIGNAALAEARARFDPSIYSGVGSNAGAGLVKGLVSAKASVAAAARSLAQSALNSINTTFDSQSPSKETEKQGVWAGMGLAKGFLGSKLLVLNAWGEVAGDLLTFGEAHLVAMVGTWGKILPEGMAAAIRDAKNWSGLLDALDGAVDGVIEDAGPSMKRLGQGLWGILAEEFGYSAEKGWHSTIADSIEAGLDVPARSESAKIKAKAARYAGEMLSDFTSDPALVGHLATAGQNLWGILAEHYSYNMETGVYDLVDKTIDHIALVVERTPIAKLRARIARYAGETLDQFTSDPGLIDQYYAGRGTPADAAAAAKRAADERARTAADMINPLRSLVDAKMPTNEEIDNFFRAYEHWLAEWDKRAASFEQTASKTTNEVTDTLGRISEAVSKVFGPLLQVTEIQAISPGAIEGAFANLWFALDQYNKVMRGGSDGTPFMGQWETDAVHFAESIGVIFGALQTSMQAVRASAEAGVGNVSGIFAEMQAGIALLMSEGLAAFKREWDPAVEGSTAQLFILRWDRTLDTSFTKLHNTSLNDMGIAEGLFIYISRNAWQGWDASVSQSIGHVISMLDAYILKLGQAGGLPGGGTSTPPGGNTSPPPYVPPGGNQQPPPLPPPPPGGVEPFRTGPDAALFGILGGGQPSRANSGIMGGGGYGGGSGGDQYYNVNVTAPVGVRTLLQQIGRKKVSDNRGLEFNEF